MAGFAWNASAFPSRRTTEPRRREGNQLDIPRKVRGFRLQPEDLPPEGGSHCFTIRFDVKSLKSEIFPFPLCCPLPRTSTVTVRSEGGAAILQP
jgi:hypothetical protein